MVSPFDTRSPFGAKRGSIPIIGGIPSFAGVDFTGGAVRTWGGFDFSLTRASTGTYIDAAGNIQTAPSNTTRLQYVGGGRTAGLFEVARTNILLNSAVVALQAVTVTAQSYSLSFYGTGSVTLSGAATGVLAGAGANSRVSLTVTASAGTLTVTPTGDVRLGQIEFGTAATSYIATAGTSAARSADISNSALSAAIQTAMASGYWVFMQGAVFGGTVGNYDRAFQLDNGDNLNRHVLVRSNPAGGFEFAQTVGGNLQGAAPKAGAIGQRLNVAARFAPNAFAANWWDGTSAADPVASFVAPTVLRIATEDSGSTSKPASILIEKIYFAAPSISRADAAAHRGLMP